MTIWKGMLLWTCVLATVQLECVPAAAGELLTAEGKYDVRFKPGEGIAAVCVVGNRAAGTFFAKLGVLILKDSATGKEVRVLDRAPTYASYSVFAAAMPAGTYELEQFENQMGSAMISVSQNTKVGATVGTFQVVEGRVTDLGTIAYVRNLYPVNATGYSLAFDEQELAMSHTRSLWESPVVAALDQGALGWLPLSPGQLRPQLTDADLVKARSLNSPILDTAGILRSGDSFGQLVTRAGDGHWSRERLPTLQSVLATATLSDGTLLAAADEGLFFMRAPGSQWTLKPLIPTATPRYIGIHDGVGIFVVAEVPDGIAVYHAAGAGGAWEEIRRIDAKLHYPNQVSTYADALLSQDHLVVTAVSVGWTVHHVMSSLALANNQWTSIATGIYGAISSFPDGRMYSMAGPNIGQALQVSADGGLTWEKRSSPNWAAQPVFRTADVGYLIRVDHIPAFNPENLTNSLWKTVDGGKTWARNSDLPNQSGRLLLLPGEGHLLLVTNNGRLMSSTDDGKNWESESL